MSKLWSGIRTAGRTRGSTSRNGVTAGPGLHVIANYAEWVRLRTNVSPAASGRVDVTPASEDGFYPHGTTLLLRAAAEGATRFYRWTAGAGGATFLAANRQGNAANPVELTLRASTAFYLASFTGEAITTIASSVPGAQITVDGTAAFAPMSFLWPVGTRHTVSVQERTLLPSSVSRLVFVEWSNGGERTQDVLAGDGGVLTAQVREQHQVLKRAASTRLVGTVIPSAARNISLDPVSADGFYDEGSELTVTAEGPAGVPFVHWYGDLGSESNPGRLRITEQSIIGANFVSPGLFSAQAVVNDASRQPGALASGALYTLYGNAIAFAAIRIGGEKAEALTVGRDQLRFRAPVLPDDSAVVMEVETAAGTVRRTLSALRASPGVYTVSGSGSGQADARNGDGSRNRKEAPAARGSTLGLRLTGIRDAATLEVTLGGVRAEILELHEGLEPGQVEVTVLLPGGCPAGPEVPVAVYSDGVRSQYGVWAAIE
jgi:uncharacterized protein (TIGR03437 family)